MEIVTKASEAAALGASDRTEPLIVSLLGFEEKLTADEHSVALRSMWNYTTGQTRSCLALHQLR